MARFYHVQFGLMRQVGRFAADTDDASYPAGCAVVVHSPRGVELGTIIAETTLPTTAKTPGESLEIVREANPADFDLARRLEVDRGRRFDDFLAIFARGEWPIEPLDLEPLLDEHAAVVSYLGPYNADLSHLRAAMRVECGLDLIFEAAGRDEAEIEAEAQAAAAQAVEAAEGSCGAGCGSGSGGCGSGCGTSSGGCAGCPVSSSAKPRRRAPANA